MTSKTKRSNERRDGTNLNDSSSKGAGLRRLVAAEFITLDGYIAGPSGHVDFDGAVADIGNEIPNELVTNQRAWGTLLMGRRTYEEISNFWAPVPVDGNPIAHFMNTVPKVVVSKTLHSAPWGGWEAARVLPQAGRREIEGLKREPGKDIAILGSANLLQQLAHQGLIDEYLLMLYPVIAGSGTPMFAPMNHGLSLKLAESRRLSSGVLVLKYHRSSGPEASASVLPDTIGPSRI